ncbi:DNA translocase FtsK [bacterium]|nr:DNA translocase FtsK [bacterium]
MISLVLVFNLSLRSVFRGIGSAFRWMYSAVETRYQAQNGTTKASVPASTWKERWARLKDVLFYTRVQEIEFKGSDVRSLQAIDKPKIEVKSFEDRLSEMEVDDDDDSDDTEDDDTEEDVFAESRSVEIPGANDDAIVPTTDTVFSNSDHDDELAGYELPSLSLLQTVKGNATKKKQRLKSAQDKAAVLEMALSSFNVEAKVVNITAGPSVTRYELKPGDGVKISKITNLAQDIALKLEAADIRIEAPIPGKALVGIEVANPSVEMVTMRSIIDETDFMKDPAKLPVTVGLTITGEPIVMKLEEMPHLLIAGATGSGKSVCVNSIIMSILLRARPDEVKFLMIDPKKVELSLYNDIPHLLAPVVTNSNKAAATLKQWPLQEMERRYETFSQMGVKHISQYNAESEIKLPYIVVIIDELADLMMVASQDVEHTICRLAQMARATGIHLVVATQRPSVNVVTGLIKANIPSRISFFVQSQIDSRTILDMGGAEKLLGKGDMLYAPVGQSHKPLRVQGVYVDEKEVKSVVDWVKAQAKPTYVHEIIDVQPILPDIEPAAEEKTDALFDQAKEIIQGTQYASTSYLQRKLRIGYNRAARLMDELEEKEVVSPMTEGKRTVL